MGHFVSSPREREKRDRRDGRDEREGQGRKRNRNESEETEEIKTSPSTLTCYKDSRPCPAVSQYQLDAPVTSDLIFSVFIASSNCHTDCQTIKYNVLLFCKMTDTYFHVYA